MTEKLTAMYISLMRKSMTNGIIYFRLYATIGGFCSKGLFYKMAERGREREGMREGRDSMHGRTDRGARFTAVKPVKFAKVKRNT